VNIERSNLLYLYINIGYSPSLLNRLLRVQLACIAVRPSEKGKRIGERKLRERESRERKRSPNTPFRHCNSRSLSENPFDFFEFSGNWAFCDHHLGSLDLHLFPGFGLFSSDPLLVFVFSFLESNF